MEVLRFGAFGLDTLRAGEAVSCNRRVDKLLPVRTGVIGLGDNHHHHHQPFRYTARRRRLPLTLVLGMEWVDQTKVADDIAANMTGRSCSVRRD